MVIGIDPTIDFAFKRMMRSPALIAIPIYFINAILGDSPRIVEIEADATTITKATPLEKWIYFLRNVAQMTSEEVAGQLGDPEFVQAAGVLEMIAKSPRERDLYESRLKLERDEAARLQYAKDEGRTEGRTEGLTEGLEKGKYLGRIHLLEQLLDLPETSPDTLDEMDIEQLSRLEGRLRIILRERS